MIVKLLAEHNLEFLSLKRGCRGSSESKLVKMPHCWKSHATTHLRNESEKCSKFEDIYRIHSPQVDDMKDESLSAVLEDIVVPPGMELCNTQTFPGYSQHSMILNIQVCTVKPVLSGHPKRRPKIGFQDQLWLNAGQKYCRMPSWSILQYFRPSLSYRLSLRPF